MSGDYQQFEYETKGWPGARFDRKTTTVQVRRVQSDGRDEAQLEITITEIKGNRMFQHHGSLSLAPKEAERFSEALLH